MRNCSFYAVAITEAFIIACHIADTTVINDSIPRDAMHIAQTMLSQDVCLSVRLSVTLRYCVETAIYTVSKNVHFCFCQNFVKFPRILIISFVR